MRSAAFGLDRAGNRAFALRHGVSAQVLQVHAGLVNQTTLVFWEFQLKEPADGIGVDREEAAVRFGVGRHGGKRDPPTRPHVHTHLRGH